MILTSLIFLGICNKVVGEDGARLCGEQAGSGRHSGQQGTRVTCPPRGCSPTAPRWGRWVQYLAFQGRHLCI